MTQEVEDVVRVLRATGSDLDLSRRVVKLDTALQMAEALTSQLILLGLDNAWKSGEKALVVGAHYEVDDHATIHGAITMHMLVMTHEGKAVQLHVTFEVAPEEGEIKRTDSRLTPMLVAFLAKQSGIELVGDLADRLA